MFFISGNLRVRAMRRSVNLYNQPSIERYKVDDVPINRMLAAEFPVSKPTVLSACHKRASALVWVSRNWRARDLNRFMPVVMAEFPSPASAAHALADVPTGPWDFFRRLGEFLGDEVGVCVDAHR